MSTPILKISKLQDKNGWTWLDDIAEEPGWGGHEHCGRFVSRMKDLPDEDDNERCIKRIAFIVRACNNHEALVAALRAIVQFGDTGVFSSVGQARAALAELEKP